MVYQRGCSHDYPQINVPSCFFSYQCLLIGCPVDCLVNDPPEDILLMTSRCHSDSASLHVPLMVF